MRVRPAWRIAASIIISVVVVIVVFAVTSRGTAVGATVKNRQGGLWSNPAIWEQGRVPVAGDRVEIAAGTDVVYDMLSETEIGGISVNGALRFSRDKSTNLDVGTVIVYPRGVLEIGTPDKPIPAKVTASVRIVNQLDGQNSIEVMGKTDIHGQPLQFVFTQLAEDADLGTQTIVVQDPVDWKRGDHIAIASTTQAPEDSEDNYIKSIRGKVITLKRPLSRWHSGSEPTQAEVANLTRNVVITSKNPKLRGHTRFLHGAQASISYAEFNKLGAKNQIGKYPIHFHMADDSMRESYVKGVSVWDSNNRFITVHSTQFVTLSYNVGYNSIGHGFFMEVGDEVYVTWEKNLGILVRPGDTIASDKTPAVFWIQNPLNTYLCNIAVGSVKGNGFDFSLPMGKLDVAPFNGTDSARDVPVLRFDENEAHSNSEAGLRVYPLSGDMGDDEVSYFKQMKLWRNGELGATIRARKAVVEDAFVFGNGFANLVIKGHDNAVVNSHLLGEIDAPLPEGQTSVGAAPRGAMFWGTNHALQNSVLEGHMANAEDGGADVSLFQDERGIISVTVSDSLLESEKPIIFGYPMHQGSFIKVENYQQEPGRGLLLFRLDAEPPVPCEHSFSQQFIANVCESGGQAAQNAQAR